MFKHTRCIFVLNNFCLNLTLVKNYSSMLNNGGATGVWQIHSNIRGGLRRSTSVETLNSAELCRYQTDGLHYCQSNMVNYEPYFYNTGYNMSHNQQGIFYNGGQMNNCVQSNYCQRRNYIKRSNSADSITRNHNVHSKVLNVLSQRVWEQVAENQSNQASHTGVVFRLMSYNVLAQDLLEGHPYLYKYHNPGSLKWRTRWSNLFQEICSTLPDIMCLQEVQESHLSEYYSKFEGLGYKGLFKKRTGFRTDGCAIYYQTKKFNLVEYETVEFFQPNVDVLNRDNVAIVAKFNPRSHPKKEFIVATTHLLYNIKRQDVRLAQTQLLLTEIERLSFVKKVGDIDEYLPIIITGDFNSTVDSAVYRFITEGVFKYTHLSARCLDDSNRNCHGNILIPSKLEVTDKCQHAALIQQRNKNQLVSRLDEACLIKLHNSEKCVKKVNTEVVQNPELFCSGTISHLFTFKSVYNHGSLNNQEATTYHDKWLTVDFIFYSGKKVGRKQKDDHGLQLISRYRLPRQNELGNMKIPNNILGSDHLCLMAIFKLVV
ncbi:protein angel isoform X2 [Rhynchophorus ferrugineus]|uniref:protein angel isoform X2 n=1 Tax=Rhynchophorus ferrugineus TaxID=354439 RepID=UPI003FCE882C